mgnify:CR=1 FL=1
MIKRKEIIKKLIEELKPIEYINAIWEGSSEACGRTDEWSEIDLGVDAKD